MSQVHGAVIDRGAADWQIFQQDARGAADISLAGRWGWGQEGEKGAVEIRIVREDTGAVVAPHLDWTPAKTQADGTWSGVLKNVPAGGLYRIETHFRTEKTAASEWSLRGDMRHLVGVGDLWIIAGQSNSSGYGREDCGDGPELGVHLFNNAMRWTLATHPLSESTDTAHPANREGGNPGVSPWLRWAKLVKEAMGFPIGLVQTSLGGSPLSVWDPASDKHPLFDLMVDAAKAAGGPARGILWYQGESDHRPPDCDTYEARFAAAVQAWRKALGSPGLHVLTVQINRYSMKGEESQDRGWSIVREAQRRVPKRLPGVSVVATTDLPLSDIIHTSSHGNLLLADRAAKAALGAAYARPVDWRAPEPVRAKRDAEAAAIEIVFESVSSRIECPDQTSVPFRVEDEQGLVPVSAVQYPGGEKVVVRLARTLAGQARVHGCYGFTPPQPPYDVARMMPMLGFYGLPIE